MQMNLHKKRGNLDQMEGIEGVNLIQSLDMFEG